MQELFFPKGKTYALYSALAFVLFFLLDLQTLAFVSFLFFFFILFSFRKMQIPPIKEETKELLSPVSGKVFSIKPSQKTGYETEIVIESSYLDDATLVFPCNGAITLFDHIKGSRVAKNSKLFSKLNEKLHLVLQLEDNLQIEIIHYLKRSLFGFETTIPMHLQNATVAKVYGFGQNTYTKIYVPSSIQLEIKIDQQLQAGQHILGYLPKGS